MASGRLVSATKRAAQSCLMLALAIIPTDARTNPSPRCRRHGYEETSSRQGQHQSDSALACSSAPHPSDPQPPNLTTKREKTDIPTLLSADILALRPRFAD